MMELNREQIIQALEFCGICECNNEKTNTECALINMPFCKNYLRQQSLSLIKELTEENEKLNERLDREAKCQYDLATKIVDLRDDVKYVKADTVQKMQERLEKKIDATIDVFDFNISECNAIRQALRGVKNDIYQVTKEMLEDNR